MGFLGRPVDESTSPLHSGQKKAVVFGRVIYIELRLWKSTVLVRDNCKDNRHA